MKHKSSTINSPTDSACLWRPELSGVELFEAHLQHHQFGKHFHETYTIGLNEGGQGCCHHRGTNHILLPSSFNLINPGDMHTGQVASGKGWTFRNIYVERSLIEQALEQMEWRGSGLPYFKVPILQVPSLCGLFYQTFQALSDSATHLQQQSLLLELLARLFHLNSEPSLTIRPVAPESKAVARVRSHLQAHYHDNVSINDLAQLTNLSPHYLIRCFRRQVGCAPHQYQRHWQLLQAKQALGTAQPLAAIATEHGFYDQSHLNRAFKQTFGVTPGQYRKGNSVQYA